MQPERKSTQMLLSVALGYWGEERRAVSERP